MGVLSKKYKSRRLRASSFPIAGGVIVSNQTLSAALHDLLKGFRRVGSELCMPVRYHRFFNPVKGKGGGKGSIQSTLVKRGEERGYS